MVAYLYLTLSGSTGFNEMFLVYTALVAARSAALVLVVPSVDTAALADRLTDGFPTRGTVSFLIAAAGMILAVVATRAPLIPVQTLSQLHAGVSLTLGELVDLIASWVVLGLVAVVLARRILVSIDAP